MTPRLQNRYTPERLDELIDKRQATLGRLLLRRISNGIRVGIPTATTCHVMRSDFTHGYVPIRIQGHHGTILWDRERHGHLATCDGFKDGGVWQVMRDIEMYVLLKPSTLRCIGPGKHLLNPDYSIHLSRLDNQGR